MLDAIASTISLSPDAILTTGSTVVDAVLSSGIIAWAVTTLWSLAMAPAQVAVMEGGHKVGVRTARRASAWVTNLLLGRHVGSAVRGLVRLALLVLVVAFAIPILARSLPEALSTVTSLLPVGA